MKMNGEHSIVRNMGAWSRLLFLFLFFIAGSCITMVLIGILAYALGSDGHIYEDIFFLKLAQVISVIGMFIIPSAIYAWVFHGKSSDYLSIGMKPPFNTIIWSLVLVIIAQPFVHMVGELNEQMTFPDAWSGIENWMRAKEDSAQKIVESFIKDKSIESYFSNILIVGVLAGIGEELIFRGCLQRIFSKIVKNKHYAIWITAFVFSAVHFQFYGFIPRLLAGAFLGYLLEWTGNLWLPIIAHAFHNILNILFAQLSYGTKYYTFTENINSAHLCIIGAISVTIFFLLISYLKRKKVFLQIATNTKALE